MKKSSLTPVKKLLSMLAVFTLISAGVAGSAYAICPVCTIAVGGILGLGEWLGVDPLLIGIWLGALTLSLASWTARWMHKKGVKNSLWYLLVFVIYYAMTFAVYFLPKVPFGHAGGPQNVFCGIDKLMLGIIVGSLGLWIGDRLYSWTKRKNDGRPWFPFQKVVMPIGVLLILTGIFATIVYC